MILIKAPVFHINATKTPNLPILIAPTWYFLKSDFCACDWAAVFHRSIVDIWPPPGWWEWFWKKRVFKGNQKRFKHLPGNQIPLFALSEQIFPARVVRPTLLFSSMSHHYLSHPVVHGRVARSAQSVILSTTMYMIMHQEKSYEKRYTPEDMDGGPYPDNEDRRFLQPYDCKPHPFERSLHSCCVPIVF